MTEKTATEASNDFFLEFRTRRKAIDDEISQSADLHKNNLTQHFTSILKQINDLEKDLTKATEYIPSYDERQFSLQLKELSDRLETTKTALTPKPKFSFKSRKKMTTGDNDKTTTTVSIPSKTMVPEGDQVLTDATVFIKDKAEQVICIKDHLQRDKERKSMDILLSGLNNCIIDLEDELVQISAIHVKNLHRCLLYCGNIQGSILIYGLTDSIVYAGCHQLRIHEAHKVDMVLHVTSRPIIEDSDGIQVGCWNLETNQQNLYDKVEDFNWLKKQASPNWRLMDCDRRKLLADLNETKHDKEKLLTVLQELLPKGSTGEVHSP
ncbi:tubulin binding cofactor C-domain-containing protein [Mycotypha africana]|uniref:tubulin binding cofactor C-domain-containing protein n=1 Tax=Mycotypha africana TaxID=64632 RepID=UPI0023003700|nr:tubulin binding cofactor C-domain-containing protein [Mycotypha africana]KAI8979533.1 tubulin binding cofactor C-domain-containing protein [Mycotypha africana]